MARPNLGVEHVDKLAGEPPTKLRLKVILMTLTGELSVNDAAERLGVGASRFHELRDEALCGALDALAPKPAGRPRNEPTPLRVLDLEEDLQRLRYELELERVRTQLLITMPEVVGKRWPPREGGRGGAGRNSRS
jgi:hypothetical protein